MLNRTFSFGHKGSTTSRARQATKWLVKPEPLRSVLAWVHLLDWGEELNVSMKSSQEAKGELLWEGAGRSRSAPGCPLLGTPGKRGHGGAEQRRDRGSRPPQLRYLSSHRAVAVLNVHLNLSACLSWWEVLLGCKYWLVNALEGG